MPISEADETAILVRKGLKIAGRHKLVMHEPWKGPKAGLEHGPRQFKWAGVWKGLIRWKGLAVHVPFGEDARDESVERIIEWLNNHRAPAFGAGDFNELLAWVRKHIAEQAKAKAAGFRIDVAVYKGMKLVKAVQLGKHGSDHHAILFVFERRNKLGKMIRFTVLIWNVEVGHDNASVNATVIELAKKYDVDMVLLSETYAKHFAAARRKGWRVIQRIKTSTKAAKKGSKK